MDRPETHYTWSDDFAIAYQVLGDGRVDLIYLPQTYSNVEWNWEVREHARFMERLASFSRLIVMDRRGVGCSDRYSPREPPTLEALVDDVLAVMAAAGSFRAALFGGARTAFIAMLAAASHPERLDGLLLYSASASWMRSDDLPWEMSEDEWSLEIDLSRRQAGSQRLADAYVRRYNPSLHGNTQTIRALGRYGVATQGLGAYLAEQEVMSRVDLRDMLPAIRVPTLVLHRSDDPMESVESGRFLAERIPGAKLVELPGNDVLPWVGESDAVLERIEEFLTGERRAVEPDRYLTTVLFTDIVDSASVAARLGDKGWRELVERHHTTVRSLLVRYRGVEADTAGDGFFATFDGPARAITCAKAIVEAVAPLGIEVRAGVHTGEVETIDDKAGGLAVVIGSRVGALAATSEVLATQTVNDLTAGSGLSFEDAGEHELKGVPDRWRLYRVI